MSWDKRGWEPPVFVKPDATRQQEYAARILDGPPVDPMPLHEIGMALISGVCSAHQLGHERLGTTFGHYIHPDASYAEARRFIFLALTGTTEQCLQHLERHGLSRKALMEGLSA